MPPVGIIDGTRDTTTDFDAEHCLLRIVRCVSGSADLSMTCQPMFDYGRLEPVWDYVDEGYGELVAEAAGSGVTLRLATDLRPGIEGPGLRARTRMVEGEAHFVALSWSSLPLPADPVSFVHVLSCTPGKTIPFRQSDGRFFDQTYQSRNCESGSLRDC